MKATTEVGARAARVRDASVVAWRRERLLRAGFDLEASETLARECGIDLHDLLDLAAAGCAPELAARILRPLPGESRAC